MENATTDVPFSQDPVPQAVIDYIAEVIEGVEQPEPQIEAYRAFCGRYDGEKNALRRVIMQNLLNYVILNEPAMKPTYAFGELLDYVLAAEKSAERKLYPRELYEMVTEVARHSVYTEGRGKSTRWTVHRGRSGYGHSEDTKRPRYAEWTATEVKGAFLRFGAHRFSVGSAAEDILASIEERYGLDFKKLERERRKAKNKSSKSAS